MVNAIYFKGDWEFKFDKSKTRKEDFHVSSTKQVQTDMMKSSGAYGVLRGIKDLNGADALDMPYKDKRLSMIFLLPARGSSLGDLEKAMSKVKDLNSILNFTQIQELYSKRKMNTDVTLPRFKLESELDLVEPLKKLGMTDMFDKFKADFSGMTGGTQDSLRHEPGCTAHHRLQ